MALRLFFFMVPAVRDDQARNGQRQIERDKSLSRVWDCLRNSVPRLSASPDLLCSPAMHGFGCAATLSMCALWMRPDIEM